MADIRINALPTTATDFASDDYIAIDGTTNGTRKLNAKTANLTFSDVTLGSSGPSVKSTLSARAPRQGLVFDGTNYCQISPSVPAAGTSNFTVTAVINTDLSVDIQGIIGTNTAGGFGLFSFSTGALAVQNVGVGTVGVSTGLVTANKASFVAYVRSGTTGTFYINGVSAGTITDGTNYNQVNNLVGTVAGLNLFKGSILAPTFYNRALSASEVVSLYEAGAPAGADYASGGANNTSLITGANSDFSSDTTFWSKAGSASIGGNQCTLPASGGTIYRGSLLTKGTKYRLSVSIVTNQTGGLYVQNYNDVGYGNITGTGTKTLEFVASGAGATTIALQNNTAGSIVIDDVTIVPIGLLLAPDAAQAGGGLVWYDTSGNAANITLPASGVRWNVPSSSYWGGTLNLAGSTNYLKISTTGTPTSGAAALQLSYDSTNSRAIRLTNVGSGGRTYDIITGGGGDAASFGLYDDTSAAYRLFIPSTGNFLIGGTIDGGQKLQVSGSGFISGSLAVGDRAAPAGVSLRVQQAGSDDVGLEWQRTSATNGILLSYNRASSAYTSLSYGASSHTFTISGTTALTLDSSQNATFAGDVFSTKSINIASGYSLTAQDSGNTYRTILRGIADNTVEIGWGTATPTNGHLIFKAGGTEQGRINPAGGWILGLTASAPVLGTNSTMTFELTSNTSLTIKVRGTDGTTRSATLTLS